jgi:hypothetical protein
VATASDQDIERLIQSLTGIHSASVISSEPGRPEEIHVLCAANLSAKQVVRNIESALSAGLGLLIDRRIVSVAQLREPLDAHAAPNGRHTAPPPAVRPEPPAPRPQPAGDAPATPPQRRFAFVGYEARSNDLDGAVCEVRIRRNRRIFSAAAAGANSVHGRATAAARALFDALCQALPDEPVGFDGVAIVEAGGRTFVLVAAHALRGRDATPLTGVAALRRSPEETAILAALQAANRWTEGDSAAADDPVAAHP